MRQRVGPGPGRWMDGMSRWVSNEDGVQLKPLGHLGVLSLSFLDMQQEDDDSCMAGAISVLGVHFFIVCR